MSPRILITITLTAAAACIAAAGSLAAGAPVSFERDVRPIFAARCVACHGAAAQKSGLRLDLKTDALEGGDSGPAILPGKSAQSDLLRRITTTDPAKRMPPTGPALTAAEVQTLRRWIDEGASWPASAQGSAKPAAASHWSFQTPKRPPLPKVKQSKWVLNPIDAFILAKLEAKGLKPSPTADRVTLIRRLSLDLLGLPPAPEDVDQFLADRAPGAYERVVDRLLASPHYGERWGRHWLDRARYADSNGYTIDSPRSIWPYRDWVIKALNEDVPFDRFTIEQIAGDLLPNATRDQLVATGFHRNTQINEEGGTDPEQFRIEAVVDRVATTGTVWLGLSLACAQCHTHKYDPISQREYYRFFAFLNNADEPFLALGTPEQQTELTRLKDDLAAALKEMAAYETRPGRNDEGRKIRKEAVEKLQAEEKKFSATVNSTMILRERPAPRETYVHMRGDFLRHGAKVTPGVPVVLNPLPPATTNPTRLDLAKWMVDPANPLTGRVAVNWVWQHHFGTGLVATENDFGTQGERPTHPELLDWLATALVSGQWSVVSGQQAAVSGQRSAVSGIGLGWSLKRLHRLIVTSNTYRQQSRPRAELREVDPDNRLLARQSRMRLEAEIIRDSALTASGMLTRTIGGPSVYPPQPEGLDLFTQNKKNWVAATGADRYRRGLYTFLWRSSPYPLFTTLDAPSASLSCTRRVRSNTPTQALMLANDASLVELAQGLATRLLALKDTPDLARLEYAFRCAVSRAPSDREKLRLLTYLQQQRTAFAETPEEAKAAGPAALPEGVTAPEAAAWTSVARVLLNLDEFITRE